MVYVDTSVVALLTVDPQTPNVLGWYARLRDAAIGW